MNHSFLLPPPNRLNQPFDGGTEGGGGAMSSMTRRKFLKRTGGASVAALVALNLCLSLNSAHAQNQPEPSASHKLKLDFVGPVDPALGFTEFTFFDALDAPVDAKIVVGISTEWLLEFPWPGDYAYIEYQYTIEYSVAYKNGPNWEVVEGASWMVICKGIAQLVNGGPSVAVSFVLPELGDALEGQPDLEFEFEGKEYEASLTYGINADGDEGTTTCVAGMLLSLKDGPIVAKVPENPPEDEPVQLGHAWSSEEK